jgi:hypothetical protein
MTSHNNINDNNMKMTQHGEVNHEAKWLRRERFLLVLERCSVRVSTVTPTALTEVLSFPSVPPKERQDNTLK